MVLEHSTTSSSFFYMNVNMAKFLEQGPQDNIKDGRVEIE